MSDKSKNNLLLIIGAAIGAGMAIDQAIRRRRAAAWRNALQAGPKGVALVTGASSGIGEIYARRLAEMGFDLVLVARRKEILESLAQEFRQSFHVQVEVLPADLSTTNGVAQVEKRIKDGDISFLVNNAGYGLPGNFLDLPAKDIEAQIRVHVLATVRLTKSALPFMVERGQGAVINVSSEAAFFAMPGDATYGPTKTFLVYFTEALALSLAQSGVRLQALCPGFTVTGFHSTPHYNGLDVHSSVPGWLWMQAGDVVDASLHCLAEGQTVCVPGRVYKIGYLLGRTGIAQPFIDLVSHLDPQLVRKLRGHQAK